MHQRFSQHGEPSVITPTAHRPFTHWSPQHSRAMGFSGSLVQGVPAAWHVQTPSQTPQRHWLESVHGAPFFRQPWHQQSRQYPEQQSSSAPHAPVPPPGFRHPLPPSEQRPSEVQVPLH